MSVEVDLTGDGGVLKQVLKSAKPDALAPSDSLPVVEVHYEGTLANTGEVFDSSRVDNAVFSFEIGAGNVIRAWECAIKTMKVGEIARITCKPEYAYGDEGSPPDIPPRATLVFEVELMDCKPRKGSTLSSVVAEQAKLSELRKEREAAAAIREEEKKKREEAKAAAAARLQDKVNAKKGKSGKANKPNK